MKEVVAQALRPYSCPQQYVQQYVQQSPPPLSLSLSLPLSPSPSLSLYLSLSGHRSCSWSTPGRRLHRRTRGRLVSSLPATSVT